jgi:hypothetical protein
MKLYNNQRNAHVFNLFIYLLLSTSEAGLQRRQWFKSPGYGVSARELTPYAGNLNNCQSCTPASEDGLKEIPKHIRKK